MPLQTRPLVFSTRGVHGLGWCGVEIFFPRPKGCGVHIFGPNDVRKFSQPNDVRVGLGWCGVVGFNIQKIKNLKFNIIFKLHH